MTGDRGGDAVARHIRKLLVHEKRGMGVTLADETRIKPLLGDALELAEQVELWLLAGVAPFCVKQAMRQVENEGGRAHVAKVLKAHLHALPNDAGYIDDRRADEVGREFENGVGVEISGETFLWKFDTVAFDAGKGDFQLVTIGTHRLDLYRIARRLRRRDNRLGGEV